MLHTREEIIARANAEFAALDTLVGALSAEEWDLPVPRPESRQPWTVKDSLAHITHWKADVTRKIKGGPKPPEERGLNIDDGNHLVYLRWHERTPAEVLAWHRQAHRDLLDALQAVPEAWFSRKDHNPKWPYDLDGHSAWHRRRDIENALKSR